jgi:pentose-5-phosphate-3-epimerase
VQRNAEVLLQAANILQIPALLTEQYPKGLGPTVARLRELLPEGMPIEVDGGIDADTAGPVAEAGATLFVAGSSIFGEPDPAAAYETIASAAGAQ